jgi:hypothetical protein
MQSNGCGARGGGSMSRKQTLGDNIQIAKLKIARCLRKGEAVPPGLAQNLGALLLKEQRSRLGQLQNMRKRGELR